MNARQAYAFRAEMVFHLRRLGYSLQQIAAALKTTKEPIRQLEARGKRIFERKQADAIEP